LDIVTRLIRDWADIVVVLEMIPYFSGLTMAGLKNLFENDLA